MSIRRNIIASAILAVGTIGSLVAGPLPTITITAAPGTTAVANCVTPNAIIVHG